MVRKFQYQHIKSPPAAAESLSKRMENMNALPRNSKRVSVPVLRPSGLLSPRTPKLTRTKLRRLVRPKSAGPPSLPAAACVTHVVRPTKLIQVLGVALEGSSCCLLHVNVRLRSSKIKKCILADYLLSQF